MAKRKATRSGEHKHMMPDGRMMSDKNMDKMMREKKAPKKKAKRY